MKADTVRAGAVIAGALTVLALLSPVAGAQSRCADLGGAVDPAGTCRIHHSGVGYRVDIAYPTTYPDESMVANHLEQERDEFVEWAEGGDGTATMALDIVHEVYRSATTESLVLTEGTDGGVHPVTTFRTFTVHLDRHIPVTIDTLFAPGSQPLAVLIPIMERELASRGAELSEGELGLDDFRYFALTDDTVTFFFGQGDLLPHVDIPLTVDVPRSALPTLLV